MRIFRSGRLGLAFAALCFSLSAAAPAQNVEAKAKKLAQDAMEEDYLATNMDAALKKLETALSTCKGKCSKELTATIHGYMATVYAAGLARQADAVAAFKKMLEIDPSAKPSSAYLTGDVQKAYDEARQAMGGTSGPKGKIAVLEEDPWTEQAMYSPVPVYVEAPEGVEVSAVSVRYRPPGETDWKEIKLQKHGEGFGGYIPCTSTSREGKLAYFVTAFDANLDRVASAGSAKQPRLVELRPALKGRQPSLPDAVPPSACPRPEERLSCETDDDCPGDQRCQDLACLPAENVVRPGETEDKIRKKSWLSLAFSPDLLFVSSSDDACSPDAQSDGKISCFFAGGVPYQGTPVDSGKSNSVTGGVGTGSMRVMAGYDHVLGTRMTVGARLGFAFLGHPDRADDKTFLPIHAEARFAFFFSKDPFAQAGVRPYVFANGGLAEAVARVNTKVVEDDGTGQRRSFTLDVYQKGGPGFAGAGGGIHYAVSPEAAMVVEVAGRAMLPTFAPVIAPSLGFAYGL